ncbi:hypothetical protein [Sulfitobacter guttiformis]|uniref:Tetratricopeptide repeat protein n=1 Tax=Sulfitobacter guttiformis TaxID=74349 RepID=A0A420DII0_9RHOB|nr:hypothetical protein [Sulfitobacter guttiformis]KIN72212.1 hypothetical protein Z949_1384 [Sulfitobacter guttiformis KCTC 32187]RKE94017.1 hypothetical protein C8N30_3122 [Sulfitobacter guttiformis]
MTGLDAELLAAHETGDQHALIDLYIRAAAESADVDTTCFFLTHAYVFALEQGDARAHLLRAQLVAHGRETPL